MRCHTGHARATLRQHRMYGGCYNKKMPKRLLDKGRCLVVIAVPACRAAALIALGDFVEKDSGARR